MGLLETHALNISGLDWLFVLTFMDDLHLAAGGGNRWRTIWRFLVAMEMVGTPFSDKKFRGGFALDYVGYWLDYSRFEIGISEERMAWLVSFVDKLEAEGRLVIRCQSFCSDVQFAVMLFSDVVYSEVFVAVMSI